MKLYTHGTDPNADILVAQWWLRMRDDGDLEKTFLQSALCLSGFMAIWSSPGVDLQLELDEQGVTVAFWVQYFMGSAMIGLWVRSDKRTHIGTLRAVLRMYRHCFDSGLGSVIGITKQPELLSEHEKLGYKVLGKVSKLWDKDNDGYVVTLEAADFYARFGHDDSSTPIPEGMSLMPRAATGTVH